ncbi:MAG: OmpA family protein [Nitrosomonadales bacterium]|nr:OmpA family protein [Nitrosomonadales bacterium]
MKRITKMALLGALLATANAGASEFAGSYLGAKIGTNNSEISGTGATSDKSTTTYGLEGGHGWDKGNFLLGVDGFYDTNRQVAHTAPADYGSKVYGLGLKLGLPMEKLMPYAKLGYARVSGTGTASSFGSSGVHGGLGLEYKFAPSWSVVGEWTAVAPSENGSKLKNNNLTLGLNYYFGAPKAAPVAPAPKPEPVVVKEEPKVVVAPAPAPVVVEPAPAPAPVVVEPAPEPKPQPKESWKTILTEKPVRLDGANFATDSAKLLKTADARLNEVVEAAAKYTEVKLAVSGHTDNVGKKAHNQTLSENRAAAVKAWLVKHGVAADRIVTAGYADEQPVADNKTKEGRAANRRVEVRYVIREETKVRVTE